MKVKPIPKGSSISVVDKKKVEKHKAHHSVLKGSTFEEAIRRL
jgi:hypothetical protein